MQKIQQASGYIYLKTNLRNPSLWGCNYFLILRWGGWRWFKFCNIPSVKVSSDAGVRVNGWCLCSGMFRVMDLVSRRQSSAPCQGQAQCLSFLCGTENSTIFVLLGKKPMLVQQQNITMRVHLHLQNSWDFLSWISGGKSFLALGLEAIPLVTPLWQLKGADSCEPSCV